MTKRYSRVAQELEHLSGLKVLQRFHYTDCSGTEGDSPALLPCQTAQREVSDKDSTGSFNLKNVYTAPVYKKSFQLIRLTQLLITTTLLRINFKMLRSSPSCRKILVKRANVAIP